MGNEGTYADYLALLIEPKGIEIQFHRIEDTLLQFLLIEPKGIEMLQEPA